MVYNNNLGFQASTWVFLAFCVVCITGFRNNLLQKFAHRPTISRLDAWCDNSVSIDVPASTEDAYELFSQLEEHPIWSPWLKSVDFDEASRESIWKLSTRGVKVQWRAVTTREEPGRALSWKSLTGLENSGLVEFEEVTPESCRVTLTVSYNIPSAIARVAKVGFVGNFAEENLKGDLRRFKTELMRRLRDRPPPPPPLAAATASPQAAAAAAAPEDREEAA
ncbi:unnamed protein product [Heterosigma akashiwo]|mmetsp:Transcript_1311/g.2534  ORF Transcript_1311/g.2534 Transcript_1311/m.2534 type:complete len:222 (-) Transcript_1311:245-910(-)